MTRPSSRHPSAIGVDTYSYHRLFGHARPGEAQVPAIFRDRPEHQIIAARGAGAEILSLETMFLPDPDGFDLGHLIDLAGPMEIVLSWGGMYGLEYGRSAAAEADLSRWIGVAARHGVRMMRIVLAHPDLRGRMPVELQLAESLPPLRRAAAEAEASGVLLALENHGDLTSFEMNAIVQDVGSAALALCFDTVNAVRVGEDASEAFRRVRPNLCMLHAKGAGPGDYERAAGPAFCRFEDSEIDVIGMCRALFEDAWAGAICVEIAQIGPDTPDELVAVATSVSALRSLRDDTQHGKVEGPR